MKICMTVSFTIFLYAIGIYLFTVGFLLKRIVVLKNSTCQVNESLWKTFESTDALGTKVEFDGCWMQRRYQRAVIVVIDALRFDFVFHNRSAISGKELPFENKLVSVTNTLYNNAQNARLYRFIADPPTTTLQRLKGLTTGSLPTFVDAGSNFASPEITEDNVIDQLFVAGQRIIFMGDDTWQGLFPGRFKKFFPYPSFNVKDLDTVDNGVIQHLLPEFRQNDWDVIIAHFLGVDHCGHTFGPLHEKMKDKLTQMDSVLRSLMEEMNDDTILFVLGDHGMTLTGDHGGDSRDEIDAALFVFSPQPITASPVPEAGFRTVSQVDLVPTLSLLLGVPIPFSNLGAIIGDLFDYDTDQENEQNQVTRLYRQISALRMNALQVSLYTEEYVKLSNELPQTKLKQLNDVLHKAEEEFIKVAELLQSNLVDDIVKSRLENIHELYRSYLHEIRLMCHDVWAQFDLKSMFLGLFLYSTALLLHYMLVSNCSMLGLSQLTSTLLKLSAAYTFAVVLFHLNLLSESLFCLSLIAASAVMIYKTKPLAELQETFSKCNLGFLDFSSLLLCLIYFLSLFSNSYVVYENFVTSFLFQALIVLTCIKTVVNIVQRMMNSDYKHSRHTKTESLFFTSPVGAVMSLYICISVAIRLSHYFWVCREEQWACEISMFLQPLSAISKTSSIQNNFRLLLSVASLITITYSTYWWMRCYGNLNGGAISVIMMSYALPFSTITIISYWLVQGLVQNLPNATIPVEILLWLPQIVYFTSLSTIIIIILWPLCLFLVPRRKNNIEKPELMLHSVTDENLVPQIFNQLKLSYQRNLSMLSGATDVTNSNAEPPVVVYGLATVYSSSQLVLLLAFVMVAVLLLGDGLAPSVMLLWMSLFVLLELNACNIRSDSQNDQVRIPWSTVVTVFFLSSEHFFSTGHQATLASIRWEAAFHGFRGDFLSNVIPAVLILINSFASYLLCTIALPLVIYWPFTRGHYAMEKNKIGKEEGKGELVLNENKKLLWQMLFSVYMKYILLFNLRMLAMMVCVTIHRRHLMVWKIFAPRFVYEIFTVVMVSSVSVLMYFFVLRVDHCIDRWIKKIET